MNLNNTIQEITSAEEAGFTKKKPKRKDAATLGAKHAARVAINRTIGDTFGKVLVGGLMQLLAREALKKV